MKTSTLIARMETEHRQALADLTLRHEAEKRRLEEALSAEASGKAAAEAAAEAERARADRDSHECRLLRDEVRECRGECDRVRGEVEKLRGEKQQLTDKLRRIQSALG